MSTTHRTAPLKRLIEPAVPGAWGSEPIGEGADAICIRVADFVRERFEAREGDEPTLRFIDPQTRERLALVPDDVLLERSGDTGYPARYVGEAGATYSNFLLRLRPASDVDPRYLWYALQWGYLSGIAASHTNRTTMSNLDVGAYLSARMPVWPLASQRAIAEYLDRETSRIDALIGAKRRMVDLLAERLRRAISEATRARLTMDSGSEPPPGWKRIPLRRCLDAADYGIGDPSQSHGEYAVLGMTNVTAGEVLGAPGGFVSAVDERLLLSPGDLLFNRTNSRELVGKVGLVRSIDRPTTFASYLVRLKTNQHLAIPEYLNYILNSREVLSLARSMALPSIGQANLNPSRYSAIVLPMPPTDEQVRLVSDLDALAGHATAMTQTLDRQIDLLAERRQALITAAVTGQLDIPEAA